MAEKDKISVKNKVPANLFALQIVDPGFGILFFPGFDF